MALRPRLLQQRAPGGGVSTMRTQRRWLPRP